MHNCEKWVRLAKKRGRIAHCRLRRVRKAVSVTVSLRIDGLDKVLQGIVGESIAQMFCFVKWRVRGDRGCCKVGLAMLCSPAVPLVTAPPLVLAPEAQAGGANGRLKPLVTAPKTEAAAAAEHDGVNWTLRLPCLASVSALHGAWLCGQLPAHPLLAALVAAMAASSA
jgi:hypothetical protein